MESIRNGQHYFSGQLSKARSLLMPPAEDEDFEKAFFEIQLGFDNLDMDAIPPRLRDEVLELERFVRSGKGSVSNAQAVKNMSPEEKARFSWLVDSLADAFDRPSLV